MKVTTGQVHFFFLIASKYWYWISNNSEFPVSLLINIYELGMISGSEETHIFTHWITVQYYNMHDFTQHVYTQRDNFCIMFTTYHSDVSNCLRLCKEL